MRSAFETISRACASLAILVAVGVWAMEHLAIAEDGSSPSEFFPKGYVVDSPAEKAESEKFPPAQAQGALSSMPGDDTSRFFEFTAPETEPTPTPQSDGGNEERGAKVRYISLVVGADNVRRFKEAYRQLRAVSDQRNVPIRDIMVVGDASALLENPDDELFSSGPEGGIFRYFTEIPESLKQIQSWPAFLIETDGGTIILEGISNLNRYLNSRGELVEPH